MSAITIQCKGSGSSPRGMSTNKKAICGHCQKSVEVSSSSGKLRKHMIRTTKSKLRGTR